jgi:CRP-like cAMP-binding protein
MEGFACRYRLQANGNRAIMAYLVPGDFCDLHVAILGEMDHSIGTLSQCAIAEIERTDIDDLTTNYPAITKAMWWATLVDEAILRSWLGSMGQKSAEKQMAHLFCELLIRLRATGRAWDSSYDFPMTQEELGDTLGITAVHVNRVLQHLRDEGLISLHGKILTILNVERLQEFAEFEPNYLHVKRRSSTA